jgi:2-phosphosulfolactate phosphatase
MDKTVIIDFLPESVLRYRHSYAVVAVDVIRATTTAVTAIAGSRRCFPVPSLESAFQVASMLGRALLAGEQDGDVPVGFDIDNSPAEIAARNHISDPVVLLSSSGTRLICNGSGCEALYVACLRNHSATARQLAAWGFDRIALLGAGSRGEFREEDQMACAWIGEQLLEVGYKPANRSTQRIIQTWSGAAPTAFLNSKSVSYLRRAGKLQDLDFILDHIDDLDTSFLFSGNEIVAVPAAHLSCQPEQALCAEISR